MNDTIELPATKTKLRGRPAEYAPRAKKVKKGYQKRSATHPSCPKLGLLALGAVIPPAIFVA
jgi:hypothetical protein